MALSLAGLPAVAQEATGDPVVSPVVVSGAGDPGCTVLDRGTRGTSDGLMQGGTGARDQILECALTLDDPRISGPASITFNDDCFGADCIFWGSMAIEGPEGSWDCAFSGAPDPTGLNDGLILQVCPGAGAYRGLTFIAQQAISFYGPADFGDGSYIHGVIYQGPPPAWASDPVATE